MFEWHGGAKLAGKAGYAVGCVASALVLVVSGYAYFVKAQVGAIGGSDVLNGGPQTGAMNILLMGLESRTDYDGNILPSDLLTAMHAGSVQGVEDGVGGQDTNTMILIHIFAGGKKAVGLAATCPAAALATPRRWRRRWRRCPGIVGARVAIGRAPTGRATRAARGPARGNAAASRVIGVTTSGNPVLATTGTTIWLPGRPSAGRPASRCETRAVGAIRGPARIRVTAGTGRVAAPGA